MDMDIDLDFEDDKIKEFLKTKLNELQLVNKRLQKNLDQRKAILAERKQQNLVENPDNVISMGWKKIWNNKYIIALKVNCNGDSVMENIQVILRWHLSDPLDYEVKIFEILETEIQPSLSFLTNHDPETCHKITDELTISNKISNTGFIVIYLELPEFTQEIQTTINGIIAYGHKQEKIINIPAIEIDPHEIIAKMNSAVPSEKLEDFLCLFTMQTFSLTFVLPPGWSSSIDSTFEIYCSLTKLSVKNKCRKYFVARKISPQINDSMIAIHSPTSENSDHYPAIVYTTNYKNLIHLIHYLHKSISGVLLLPTMYYKRYILKVGVDEDAAKTRLVNALENEMDLVKDYLEKIKMDPDYSSREEFLKFRLALARLEEKSDMEYAKIVHKET